MNVGLDPAGVIFYTDMYKGCQINPGTANLTDIFYTDGNGYGTINEVGTLNIYGNAGVAPQPGCCLSPNIQCNPTYYILKCRSEFFFCISIKYCH